jgi:von Willebrand factor type A domain-containing protein
MKSTTTTSQIEEVTMNGPGRIRRSVVLLFIGVVFAIFMGTPEQASAQPVLNFKRIVNNWPTIELYFTVACNGQPEYNFNKEQNFRVVENGIEIGTFTLWCPDPRIRCAISVALVFDASGSMNGAGNAGAKAAGNAFVDLMDGLVDEAAIIWFTSAVTVRLGMTTNLTDLHTAINSLPASGATAVWDGIYVGLQELINSGNNPCRAVIAMTDGGDNSSTRTPQDIISLANRNRIRVFTIGLGGVTPAQLETIALLTGGKYYQAPSANQLVAIYEEISTIIFGGFLECLITYQAKCMDGGLRTVDLTLMSFCNGSDTKTKTYRAPKDTSTYLPLEIALGERKGRGGSEVKIPLDLVTPIFPKDNFEPATFTIVYDPSCVQFKNIETPPGTLLNGVPITIDPIPGGVSFTTTQRIQIEGNGTLAELTFVLSDPDDTTCCPIQLATWVFEAGCFKPILKDGEICIEPRAPVIQCALQMPTALAWIRSAKDYSPNPFTVTARVFNTGDKEARNTRFKIDYDPADFQLISPFSDLQPGTPIDVPPAETSEAAWLVRAKQRTSGDSAEICITAMFDNHENVTCCQKVFIPPTEPILECIITAPIITADNDKQRYVPMPFEVTINVTNSGGMQTDSVFATIIVPPDLSLAGPDAPNNHTKKISPPFLLPNQSGSTSWFLKHPITLVQTEYVIEVWVKTSNADSSKCEYKVVIPPLEAPSLQAQCQVPGQLVFDENIPPDGAYSPNPFQVTLSAVNTGSMSANNVTGFMYLPGNCVLDPPTQDLTYNFGTLDKWNVGDPIPSQTWTVRYTKKLRYNTTLEFKWAIAGMGPTGIPTDTVNAYCEVDVPGLKPSFDCEIFAPDSLGLNAEGTGYVPSSTFDYTYRIWNTSNQDATIQYVEVYYPNDGITLDASTTKRQNINVLLKPGEEALVTWTFHVTGQITRRNLNIQAVAVDDEGNPITCNKWIPIAALRTSLFCSAEVDDGNDVIRYDQILRDYINKEWIITGIITNVAFQVTNVTATIKVDDPLNLVEFNPGFGANDNPQTFVFIPGGQSRNAQWGFRLAQPNLTGVTQFVKFQIDYYSNETPLIENSCNVFVQIQPVLTPKLICSLQASPSDQILFNEDHYEPNPFDVLLRVENIGNGDAQNVKAYVLQDQRFSTAPAPAQSYRELGSLPAGQVVGFGDNDGFGLKVNPRSTDGWDTVHVVVVADGIPETVCFIPIFVQAEKRPVWDMLCTSTALLSFDENLDDYVPNPFEVTTTVTNVGLVTAYDCRLVFVGPKKFTPHGQTSTQTIDVGVGVGVVPVDSSFTFVWNMKALRQEIATTENMHFQVVGKGGLGEDLVIGECLVPITIPPARAAIYDLTCSSPAQIAFDNASGAYIPDPFQYRVTIKNIGEAAGQDIRLEPDLTGPVVLANGEDPFKMIPLLGVNEEIEVIWLVNAIATATGETANLCVDLVDKFNKTDRCCSETYIPPATEATLSLNCRPEFDALVVDQSIGDYEVNPFKVFLMVTNMGQRVADSVEATLIPLTRDLTISAPSVATVLLAERLNPGESIPMEAEWFLKAVPRLQSGDVQVKFIVRAKGLAARECIVTIYIPEIGRPVLDCNGTITTNVTNGIDDMTLSFDESIGDFEGNQSSASTAYNVFRLTVDVHNRGEAQANNVRVILTPDGAVFDDGFPASQSVGDIPANSFKPTFWDLRPLRDTADFARTFELKVISENADLSTCSFTLTIEKAPNDVKVEIPIDLVGQYGDKIAVPIYMGPTIGKDLRAYKLNIKYDSDVVRLISATNTDTQTQLSGWNGPRTDTLKSNPSLMHPDIVRVEDYTTGAPLNSTEKDVLIYLLFEAIYNPAHDEDIDLAKKSDLEFIKSIDIDGKTLVSSMNSLVDDENGDIHLNLEDGMVTVSGDCIVPLNSSLKFQLEQNKPNPFNPSTVIEYTVGFDTHVKLTIFNALGNHVRTLVSEYQKAGEYRQVFNASGLPSGTYIYKLETPRYTEIKRMVLTR